MEGHFKLAHKWGCVLLLDEADVFLAKRSVSETPTSLAKNRLLTRNRKATSRETDWSPVCHPLT